MTDETKDIGYMVCLDVVFSQIGQLHNYIELFMLLAK